MKRKFGWNTLLSVVALFAAGACGGGAHDKPTGPTATGEVTLTLVHNTSSQIPEWADSAFVRVVNSDLAIDIVLPVKIPVPGASTSIDLTVPVGSGYTITVIAFSDIHDGIRTTPAAGETAGVTVVPGANQVSVSVLPWTYTLAGPDTIQSGQPVTYTLTLTGGPTDFLTDQVAFQYVYGLNGGNNRIDFSRTGLSAAATITVPPMSTDTTLYFGYSLFVDDAAFQTHSLSFAADLPFIVDPNTNNHLQGFHRPVKAAQGDVTITFDKTKAH